MIPEEPSFFSEVHEQALALLRVKEQTLALLCAVDDHDLMERPALIAKEIIRLSYGAGQTSVYVERQEDLGFRAGISKTKIADALYALTEANILQIYPEQKIYEILPNVAQWSARPRCRLGLAKAQEIALEIIHEDRRRRSEQREMGEIEHTFQPEATLRQLIGQNARDEAISSAEQTSALVATEPKPVAPFARSTDPDARERVPHPHTSGTIGLIKIPIPLRLGDGFREAARKGWQVPRKGTSDPATSPQSAFKVPLKETFDGAKPPDPPGQFPFGELPRERASDVPNHLSHLSHLVKTESKLTSVSHPDVGDGCGSHEFPDGGSERYTGELRADLQLAMGQEGWRQYRPAWEAYIRCDRQTVVEVLADYRLAIARPDRKKPIPDPGAWMGRAFKRTSPKWRLRR